ncbi:MAG: 1-deoxy-D-xylulose-5-phosphate synthase [Clostridiales bacterium]|nr:1-deoxy-D-xylulose-5-phosphate synthase [Clostridiales bacterium]
MQNGNRYDLSQLTDQEGVALCEELRKKLIASVSQTGGHLASNLGVVELTVAIHRVYDTSKDRLVFDVGHQCYVHKILTGREEEMDTLRSFGGISGFPKPKESVHDAFIAGHASNSVSVAVGMARARTLLHQDYNVIALIGDGALTGGLAYEGLSDAGASGENMLVILNDNGMSITRNVGGVSKLLARQHLRPRYLALKRGYRNVMMKTPVGASVYNVSSKIKKDIKGTLLPSSFFEDMGFTYLGPVNGHDLSELTRLLKWAKSLSGPVLLHVRTVKGKGYPPAERTPDKFHGVSPFDVATGEPLCQGGPNFSAVFGEALCQLAEEDERVCAVTAAMQSGTGLSEFAKRFPRRFFDVGIAEGHAVTMCAGMASQGLIPVFAVYSTFLQRSFDMMIHDVAIEGLHVVLCVDRAGLVGEDGETHQGIFGLSLLSTVPGMTVFAPSSFAELRAMLRQAVLEVSGPVAVRYPRGGELVFHGDTSGETVTVLEEGGDVTLVSYGIMIGEVLQAAELLREAGFAPEVIKVNRVVPLDSTKIRASAAKTGCVLICEEETEPNSVGQFVASELATGERNCKVKLLNTGSGFVTHGTVAELRDMLGIDAAHIAAAAREAMGRG